MEKEEPIKPNYYAIIPAGIRYSKDLQPGAKLLFGEITALCNKQGFCWASNAYFARLYGIDKSTVSRWLNKLSAIGAITTTLYYKEGNSKYVEKREIGICKNAYPIGKNAPPIGKNEEGVVQKCNDPLCKNEEENNTSNNNTINNITSSDQGQMFAKFWKAYPKPLHKNQTYNIFSELKPNQELFDKIMDAITQMSSLNRKYIVGSIRFLEERKWEEYTSKVPKKGKVYPKGMSPREIAKRQIQEEKGLI